MTHTNPAWGDRGEKTIWDSKKACLKSIKQRNNSDLFSRFALDLHVKCHQSLWKQHLTDVIKVLAKNKLKTTREKGK